MLLARACTQTPTIDNKLASTTEALIGIVTHRPISAKSGSAAASKKLPFGDTGASFAPKKHTQIAGLQPSGSFEASSATSSCRKRKGNGETGGELRGGKKMKCRGDTCGRGVNTQEPESESKAHLEVQSKMNLKVKVLSSDDDALAQMESNEYQKLAIENKLLDEEIVITHLHANLLAIKSAKARLALLEALRQLNMFKARLVENYGQVAQDLISSSSNGYG
jgi:hypothetical protein